MKKLVLFAFASLVIISCRKDDETENEKPSFFGTWKYSQNIIYSGKDNSVLLSETISPSDCSSKNKFAFTNDQFSFSYFKNVNNGCEIDHITTGDYTYEESSKILTLKEYFNFTYITTQSTVEYFSNKELHIAYLFIDQNNDGIADKQVIVLKK